VGLAPFVVEVGNLEMFYNKQWGKNMWCLILMEQ